MTENWEEVIWRSLRNACSESELEELRRWRDQSQTHERVYQDIKEITETGSLLKGVDLLQKERAWNNVMGQVKRKSKIRLRVFRYAAVLMLPLLAVGTWVYFQQFDEQPGKLVTPLAVERIQPGGPKAMLYLSDGQMVDLNSTSDSVIVDGHSGQRIALSREVKALNYSQVEGMNEGVAEQVCNKILVPRGGEYMLILSDGTRVWLNSETRLEYPLAFGGGCREVRLSGEAFFEVTRDEGRPFHVVMDGATIEVAGTSFNATCYPGDGRCQAVLESGKINLVTDGGRVTKVGVGESACYDAASGKVAVEPVNLKYYTAWRYGTFYFYDTPLSEIVRQLGRWYDVEFMFTDDSLREVCFSGAALRSKPIEFILELLAGTQSLRFEIQKNGIITIYRK